MADLAELGIVVSYKDQHNAAAKLDKIATSADKAERATKKASDAIAKQKTATQQAAAGYSQLMGELNKLSSALSTVGRTQYGLTDLKNKLKEIEKAARDSKNSGQLSAQGYQRLGAASDKLSSKIREQTATVKALSSQELKYADIAAQAHIQELKYAQAKQSNIALVRAEEEARKRETARRKADIAALEQELLAQDKLVKKRKEVAASYAAHDRAAQKYNADINKQQAQLGMLAEAYQNITRRIKQFGAFMVAAFVLTSVIQGIRGAITAIVDFDQALKSLQAIAGATAIEASVMGDEIKKIAADTKFSAQEVAEGMQTIGKAGFTAGEALKMIKGVSNLATGALEDFNTVSSLVVTAVRAFGLEVVQTGEITDIFANAITKSKLSVDSLVTAFGYVGAAGAQAGLSLNEVSGSLMVLADNGIRASTMGTAFRKTLLSMIAPNKSLTTALDEVGLSIDDINPGLVGYEKALKTIAPLVWDFDRSTVDMAKAQEFFGIRASQVAAILIRETAQGGGISRAIESTRELGAALRMAEKQQEGLGVKFKNLVDSVKNVALAVGEAGLTNTLHNLVDALKEVSLLTETTIKKFPIVQIIGYTTAVVGLSAALFGVGKALLFITPALKTFSLAMAASPWGGVLVGLTAAITALAHFRGKTDAVAESLKKQGVALSENVSTLEGWERTLDSAAKKGASEYTSMLIRFVSENKELSSELVNVINEHNLLNGEMAKSMEQVVALTGGFSEYSAVIKEAFSIKTFNDAKIALDKFSEAFSLSLAKTEKLSNSRNIEFNPLIGGFSKIKKDIKLDLDVINSEINDFARELVKTAEKAPDADLFIKKYLDAYANYPEVIDSIMTQVEAIIEQKTGKTETKVEAYNKALVNMFKVPESFFEDMEKLSKNYSSIDEYIAKNTLGDFDFQKSQAQKTFDGLFAMAIGDNEKRKKLQVAFNNVISKLREDETERVKAEYKKQLDLKKEQLEKLYELEIGFMKNPAAINLTDKELRMIVSKEEVSATKELLKERQDALDEFEKAYTETTLYTFDQERKATDEQYDYLKKNLGDRLDLFMWYAEKMDQIDKQEKDFFAKEDDKIKTPFEEYLKYLDDSLDATNLLQDATVGAFKGMEDALTEFVTTGKLQWKEYARAALVEIARIHVRSAVINPLAKSFEGSSLFSGIGSIFSSLFHEGGTVGQSTASRAVSPMLFAGAPRLHDGLLPGEYPAILERGETVRTTAQEAALNKDPKVTVNVVNNMGGQAEPKVTSSKDNFGNTIIGIVIDAAQRNVNGFGNVIKGVAKA